MSAIIFLRYVRVRVRVRHFVFYDVRVRSVSAILFFMMSVSAPCPRTRADKGVRDPGCPCPPNSAVKIDLHIHFLLKPWVIQLII